MRLVSLASSSEEESGWRKGRRRGASGEFQSEIVNQDFCSVIGLGMECSRHPLAVGLELPSAPSFSGIVK